MADPAHQAQANTQLLTKFTAILRDPADFTDKDVLPPMRGPPMTIRLTDDAQPFFSECSLSDALRVVCLRGRSSSAHGAARHHRSCPSRLANRLTCIAPITFTHKASGGLRACCDLCRLNQFVRRPTHPCPTPRDTVSEISPGALLFTTTDALSGSGRSHWLRSSACSRLISRHGVATDIFAHPWAF